jgi:hypothetical protein
MALAEAQRASEASPEEKEQNTTSTLWMGCFLPKSGRLSSPFTRENDFPHPLQKKKKKKKKNTPPPPNEGEKKKT